IALGLTQLVFLAGGYATRNEREEFSPSIKEQENFDLEKKQLGMAGVFKTHRRSADAEPDEEDELIKLKRIPEQTEDSLLYNECPKRLLPLNGFLWQEDRSSKTLQHRNRLYITERATARPQLHDIGLLS
ncbi:Hypothetical predicted protein, partial [Paramuricea clavata]